MSADNMPKLPVLLQRADQFYGTENVGDAARAYARAYAAEQTRELVEALIALDDAYCRAGETMNATQRFQDRRTLIAARALIAKHKEKL